MHLTALHAERLRNLKEVDLRFPEGLTVVAGGNGQGKTSLLEAAYVLGTGRSFRTRRLEDLVAWGDESASVVGRVRGRRGEVELAAAIGKTERALLVNGAKRGLDSFLGRLDLVDLTAPRMGVLRGGPDERRRFLDRGTVGLDPSQLRVIGEYRRALMQRNALLRRGRTGGGAGAMQLDAWDERFIAAATALHGARRDYAARIGVALSRVGPELLPGGASPVLHYRPSPRELGGLDDGAEEVLAERVARCRQRDRELGHTSEGPHRDDLVVELDGIDLRRFGSAGQARAAMIALKLAKLSLLRDERGEAPLFLMDDFDTDLDEARMEALAGHLHGAGFQAVVATSKHDVSSRLEVAELRLEMDDGMARVA